MARKKTADLPKNFNSMRIKESSRVKTFVTDEERKLRAIGLSYQKIADHLGRSKLTVMYHLKEIEWVEQLRADNKERSRVWYKNNKDKRHRYYEYKKELLKKGEME